jgi:hypothetical protein
MTFTTWGVRDFTVQGWNGSSWVTLATVSGNNLVKRTVTFAPYTTDRIRISVTNAAGGLSRITELQAWGTSVSTTPPKVNVALAGAGATASASSTYSTGFPASGAINGEAAGWNWGGGSGGWKDATSNAWPDWLQVAFAGSKTIDRVVVFSVQDDFEDPVEPTDTMTFTRWGLRDFSVQAWNGSSWVTLATVSGNTLVKREVTFAPYATERIRINVTNALNSLSRITEVQAWGN